MTHHARVTSVKIAGIAVMSPKTARLCG